MDVEERRVGPITVIVPKGHLDSLTSPELQPKLLGPLENGEPVVVDCANLDYVSSAGLRVLMMAAKKGRANGARIVLAALQPTVRKVFDISGFSALFEIHDSATEACAALSPEQG
ncbi:MAG: STAS domain-containing protein [Geminicoccaceae bacterium]|nr:STAS domain-containing protein [Geminicoccaceae bacterium]